MNAEPESGPTPDGAGVLVVDDEAEIRQVLADTLEEEGYAVRTAAEAEAAEAAVAEQRPDLVLLDIWMPGRDGMELLREWVAEGQPPFQVVMMSGHSTIESAVEATRLGAYDYLEKPLSLDKLLLTVEHAVEATRLRQENEALRQGGDGGAVLVGESPAMRALKDRIGRVAASHGAVLIRGEPGAGKEAVARVLHRQSGRRGPFVAINSAAIAAEGMEAQLFGTEGDEAGQPGRFEQANGGVLFLDEVADMQPGVQARLVRVLEEQQFTRVGGTWPVAVDVRVVAATNQDLEALIQEGGFRRDLYYRLNVLPLEVPPLRDRPEDIPALVAHFMAEHSRREGLRPRTFAPEALAQLEGHGWPGNVRELQNLVERLLILSEADPIGAGDVRLAMGTATPPGLPEDLLAGSLREAREDFERYYLSHCLRANRGNVSRTSTAAGLERTHLYRKLKQLGLDAADFKPDRPADSDG